MSKALEAAISVIKPFEGCKLTAYKCPAGLWTIGYGSTYYEDGSPIKRGDTITALRAETLLVHTVTEFDNGVRRLVKSAINDNQRGALISFAFNVGLDIDADFIAEGLGDSTLLKLVNANPNDPAIRAEFLKWNKAEGKVLNGLTRRRKAEADLYFKGV